MSCQRIRVMKLIKISSDLMNTLIKLLIVITLTGCNYDLGSKAERGTVIILNKKEGLTYRWNTRYYKMYIYNGTDSKWYNTDQSTYNMYNIGDTINTLIFTNE